MNMDGETRAAIARNVKTLRNRARLSQSQLAQRAGVAQTLISYLENPAGKSPTLDTLESIAAALRAPLWSLLLPDLPADPRVLATLDKLAATYLRVDDDGRRTLDAIAEAEARYSDTRKA
jgi:transcriptional regulator with XRE-family HTH domain